MSSVEQVKLQLVRPSSGYERSFIKGLDEITLESERRAWIYLGDDADLELPKKNFNEYIRLLLERQEVPRPDFVPGSVFWAIQNSEVVGRIGLRHELNEVLSLMGGHIGYIVRPSKRGAGIATEMLRQVLLTDRARSIGKILITCDEHNVASERTIMKNGGVFEKVISYSETKPRKKRFWIDLSLPGSS